MDDRIPNSSSDADAYDSADGRLFMQRTEKLLADPRVCGYFRNSLVSSKDVLKTLAGGQAFDQATMRESYKRYSEFRKLIRPQPRGVGAVISFIRGRPIAMSRLRNLQERWLADTVESVIYPNVVEAINKVLLGKDYRKLWVEPESEGLKKLVCHERWRSFVS